MAQASCAFSSEHNPLQASFESAMGYPAANGILNLVTIVVCAYDQPIPSGHTGDRNAHHLLQPD